MDDRKAFVGPTYAAELFDVSIDTVYGWVARGYCPEPLRVGKYLRWRPEAWHEWAEAQRQPRRQVSA